MPQFVTDIILTKQEYTPKFKDGAVQRISSGQSMGAVAKGLGLVDRPVAELGCLRTAWTHAASYRPDAHRVARSAMLESPCQKWPQ